MPSYERIRDRLPGLYRPEDDDASLMNRTLRAVARLLDRLDREAGEVMQAHWLAHADRALFSPFVLRSRFLRELPPPAPGDPELLRHPYIDDLARLGALLALLPWREPFAGREAVEAYRRRIGRIVALYRYGLGTVGAVRAITEAQLPVDLAAPPGLQDRPLLVEEFAPLAGEGRAIPARGAPLDIVGPLMRWRLENDGRAAAAPTLYLQGVTSDPGRVDATARPVIELYAAGNARVRRGIAYEGPLAPGQTLRLRPAYASWIGSDEGLRRAESPADPSAAGPWQAAEGAPEGAVTALIQTRDAALWAAVNAAGAGALHRFDGSAWTEVLTGLSPVLCLALDNDDLLAGTESGLLRLPLHPPQEEPPAFLAGPAVHALLRATNGTWYAGTEIGLARLGEGDALEPFVLRADENTGIPVYALHEDRAGTLTIGTARGLFQYQAGLNHWYWYRGKERSDQIPDWNPFFPGREGTERGFPGENDAFLPPVRAVWRGPDASLWIGTDRGIARYRAQSVGGPSYTTLLESFPDLASGRVFAIAEDERGLVWFATEQGLFRFDGRDWWQVQGDVPVRLALGSAAPADPETVRQWRFNRKSAAWEFFDGAFFRPDPWKSFTGPARGAAEKAVRALAWTDGVAADLGAWDGTTFTAEEGAAPAPLRMRYKPTEDRIVEGGIPAVPRLPPGVSEWRYLMREPEVVPTPRTFPAWTMEGRLLPPPPDRAAPEEGRYGASGAQELSVYDAAVYTYNPAARVWLAWEPRRPLTVLARLRTQSPGERIDPAVLDRVWQGIEQVRPAGVRALLAVDEEIVRGK